MKKIVYLPRIVDQILKFKLKTFGGVQVVGPKWCGKTETSKQSAKSIIDLSDEKLIFTYNQMPSLALEKDKPTLIDEWQEIPTLWDMVRHYCDNNNGTGHFILTGSSSKKVKTKHTGTGRISTIKMYPMSLYESKESNGTISLKDLFDKKQIDFKKAKSNLSLKDIIFASCRGGWPQSLSLSSKESQLEIVKDYFAQIWERDIFSIDKVKRNKYVMKDLLLSYARNISTLATDKTIWQDLQNHKISIKTCKNYIGVLQDLFVLDDIYGWRPNIRSSAALRNGPKRLFVDPSLAVAALNLSPDYFLNDLKTFGLIFENLCIRDLKIYSTALRGELSYYHDNNDLECDCVLRLQDGKYALIEIKMSEYGINEAINNLNRIEAKIKSSNKKSKGLFQPLPYLKIILTNTEQAMITKDNIYIIPIGCLKD